MKSLIEYYLKKNNVLSKSGKYPRKSIEAAIKYVKATGEMSAEDLEEGGEYFDAAQELARVAKRTGIFDQVMPFDTYQGPYAKLETGDRVWFTEQPGVFFLELMAPGSMKGSGFEADEDFIAEFYAQMKKHKPEYRHLRLVKGSVGKKRQEIKNELISELNSLGIKVGESGTVKRSDIISALSFFSAKSSSSQSYPREVFSKSKWVSFAKETLDEDWWDFAKFGDLMEKVFKSEGAIDSVLWSGANPSGTEDRTWVRTWAACEKGDVSGMLKSPDASHVKYILDIFKKVGYTPVHGAKGKVYNKIPKTQAEYAIEVRKLEKEGLTTSDAQAEVDARLMRAGYDVNTLRKVESSK